MATSAFKSTSKRGNFGTSSTTPALPRESNTEDAKKKVPLRRSRSVSAFSRSYTDPSKVSSLSNTVDFSNKRDNPLFSTSNSSSPEGFEPENPIRIAKFEDALARLDESTPKTTDSGVLDGRRGRSVSRSSDSSKQFSGPRREVGRSLSRVDTGRQRRSVSRGPHGNSESEAEYELTLPANLRNKSNNSSVANSQKGVDQSTNASRVTEQSKSSQTWSSRHPLLDNSNGVTSYTRGKSKEDGICSNSQSEAEEKTIRSVFEQIKTSQNDQTEGDAGSHGIYETVRTEVRRAISEIRNDLANAVRGKNAAIFSTTNVTDIPPELVNPNAIELLSDIRREYATKLEQSQVRARKLREDLAIEEQRGQELSRILKEVLPNPKTPETSHSRPRRKTSIERRKMSKRLTEEALNYFDECVSISTFDSSDFSAPEDPVFNSFAVTSSLGGSGSTASTPISNDRIYRKKELDNQSQASFIHDLSDLTPCSSSCEIIQSSTNIDQINLSGDPNLISLASTEIENVNDIRNLVKKFEKGRQNEASEPCNTGPRYNADEYNFCMSAERILFDRIIFRNRIESGDLLLCNIRIY
ncbi:hypothetical protein H6P81_002989 [Aristolochia fimbriata]|uniref:Uncharacterized protein n=1 Tax=Aristolochia fimbriata TaxID=158543 RepID=A0AAV7FCF0_ARIFI|nr:hypothetical protein H6P81_002989 [Aristolochia fimbriata]